MKKWSTTFLYFFAKITVMYTNNNHKLMDLYCGVVSVEGEKYEKLRRYSLGKIWRHFWFQIQTNVGPEVGCGKSKFSIKFFGNGTIDMKN